MSTAALIVAAGRGLRAKSPTGTGDSAGTHFRPKQYAQIGPHAVLTLTLQAFIRHPMIATIQVVIHQDDHKLYDSVLADLNRSLPDWSAAKLLPPVNGGNSRQRSVYNGLLALRDWHQDKGDAAASQIVLVHDGARPYVSDQLITAVAKAARCHGGAIAALPVTDTLKRQNTEGCIEGTIERQGLWRAQTPQGFGVTALLAAHQAAQAAERHDFTDDAAIAEWAGITVKLVEGSAANIKLTTAEDLAMASTLHSAVDGAAVDAAAADAAASDRPSPAKLPTGNWPDIRIGSGFDVHRLCAGDHVWLCGVKLAHTQGLDGHSDADVGLHALTDAILGAMADGDIGSHFPPNDPKWKDASSDQFLRDAASRVTAAGGLINHVDVTIICETPKIGPHRHAMRRTIGEILNIAAERVSVKATTTEQLGFTGRGQGIAAMASATVLLPH